MHARLAVRERLPVWALVSLLASASVVSAAAAAPDSTRAPAGPESLAAAVPPAPTLALPAPAPGLLDRALAGGKQAPEAAPPEYGDLTVANRPIIRFRATFMGYSPELRAEAAGTQIQSLLARGVSGPVTSRSTPDGIMIELGGTPLFRILPGDMDVTPGQTIEGLRDATVANLSLALGEVQEARSLPYLARAGARAAAITALVIALIFLARRLIGRLRGRLERRAAAYVHRAEAGGFALLKPRQVAAVVKTIVDLASWALFLILAYSWLTFVLRQFPYTRPWGGALRGYLVALAAYVIHAVLGALPGLAIICLIVVAVRWIQRLLSSFFDAVEQGRAAFAGLHPDTVPATRRIASALLWLLALAMGYPYLPGANSAVFQGVTVVAGLMLSLGSSTFIGQFLSGMMIIYSREMRVGDYVRVGEIEGTVTAIGAFTTVIHTNRREQVNIPNSVVLGQETKNYTLFRGEHGVITGTSVTIGYGTPWRQVHAMLLQAAERTPGIKKTPPPFVLQAALTDFYVEYSVNGYLERPESRILTLAALHANIQDAFNEHGVQILSPHYESDPPAPVFVPKDRWYETPAVREPAAGEGKTP